MADYTPEALAALAQRFITFADVECGDYAPFYDRLARGIAGDADLLALAAHARRGQQPPNLLLAAVHYLVLRGTQHPLAAFYPSSAANTTRTDDPFPAFRDFCVIHAEAITALVAERLVQTNEVQRCGFLLPAFRRIAERAGGRPLALIEVGASAGLNLLFDRYAYDYGNGVRAGDPAAPVQIHTEVRGSVSVPVAGPMPKIGFRAGIDLHPIPADNPDEVLWLRALVWPEHGDRAARLEAALTTARQRPPLLIAGDALEVLPGLVASVPPGMAVCVFHSNTLAHFPKEARARFLELVPSMARVRPLFWLWFEGPRDPLPVLRLRDYVTQTGAEEERLAYAHEHGAWVEWLAVR